jgi:hypothetical protein
LAAVPGLPFCACGEMTETADVRVAAFQAELAEISGPVTNFIRKHITTGTTVGITDAAYFELRRQIAERYRIHPSAIVVVGSMKLGFSLKAKSKQHGVAGVRFLPFDGDSDVDVAVVSTSLFDSLWDEFFRLSGPRAQSVLQDEQRQKALVGLFSGWISPADLPPSSSAKVAESWRVFFDRLTRARICGVRTVKGRIYRDWARLEAYQALMVHECRVALARADGAKK